MFLRHDEAVDIRRVTDEVMAGLAALIEDRRKRGEVAADVDPALAAASSFLLYYGILTAWLTGFLPDADVRDRALTDSLTVHWRGLDRPGGSTTAPKRRPQERRHHAITERQVNLETYGKALLGVEPDSRRSSDASDREHLPRRHQAHVAVGIQRFDLPRVLDASLEHQRRVHRQARGLRRRGPDHAGPAVDADAITRGLNGTLPLEFSHAGNRPGRRDRLKVGASDGLGRLDRDHSAIDERREDADEQRRSGGKDPGDPPRSGRRLREMQQDELTARADLDVCIDRVARPFLGRERLVLDERVGRGAAAARLSQRMHHVTDAGDQVFVCHTRPFSSARHQFSKLRRAFCRNDFTSLFENPVSRSISW